MGPRQTAVDTLSDSTGSRPKAEVGQSVGKNDRNRRLRTSTPRRAPVQAATGPTVVRAGRRRLAERQNRFPRRRTNPIEVSGRPTGRPRRGRVASFSDFLLTQVASRAALHAQIGSRNMTSVSFSTQAGLRITEVPSPELPRRSGESNLHAIRDGIRVLRTVLRDHRSGACGHLAQAARQLRRAARPLRAASAVAGQ